MNKVAVMVTGITRNFFYDWLKINQGILNNLKNAEVTFFFQLWDKNHFPNYLNNNDLITSNNIFENETITSQDLSSLGFISVELSYSNMYEKIEEKSNAFFKKNDITGIKLFNTKDKKLFMNDIIYYASMCHFYSQPYSWYETYKKIKEHEINNDINFDYIIKTRYDCFFEDSFKNVITYFSEIKEDFLFPGSGKWNQNRFIESKKNVSDSNGVHDQWFVLRKTERSDVIMENLLPTIFEIHLNTNFIKHEKIAFEPCLFKALQTINATIATRYFDFVILRDKKNLVADYKMFIEDKIIPSYKHSESFINISKLENKFKHE